MVKENWEKPREIWLTDLRQDVVIGSQRKERAKIVAEEIKGTIGEEKANGCKNDDSQMVLDW